MRKILLSIFMATVLCLCGCDTNEQPELSETTTTMGETIDNGTVATDETVEDEMTLPDGFDEDEWYYDEEGNLVNRYPNEFDENGNIIVRIPEDVKVGDTLNDGTIYLKDENLELDNLQGLLDKYNMNAAEDRQSVLFTTDEYAGYIEGFGENHDLRYRVRKTADGYSEDVLYRNDGTVSIQYTEYDKNGEVSAITYDNSDSETINRVEYRGNIVDDKIIYRDGSIKKRVVYELMESGDNATKVILLVDSKGRKTEYEYADKTAEIISIMKVTHSDGLTYTYEMDGKGNDASNVVKMTITKNGKTTVYTSNLPFTQGIYLTPPGPLEHY